MIDKLKSHFLNLYAMALSDSQIGTVELEMLYKIGEEKGVDKSQIDHVILNPGNVKFSLPETLNEKVIYLYDFAKIILADGVVDENERKMLELFCNRFGFEEENVSSIADFLIGSAKDNIPVNDLLLIINENLN